MDTLLRAVTNKQNIIITSLGGVERSRFLLRSELILLSRIDKQKSFSKIFHVVNWDVDVTKISNEAALLSFNDMGLKVAKLYSTETDENKSDPVELLQAAHLIVCPMKYVLDLNAAKQSSLSRDNALIVFDGIPLDSLEGACCELSETKMVTNSPCHEFGLLSRASWSIVLACNRPIEGIEVELGCSFPIVIDQDLRGFRGYRVFSSIITTGPTGVPMSFSGGQKQSGIHDEVGSIVEECARRMDSGGIVVFLSSYGKMVEFHNHWQKSGLFERIGLTYARENRADGQLKQMLINFSSQGKKSIALISHRFHQNIHFSDCVLSSSARLIISVGLPYPFTNDTWDARMKHNDQVCLKQVGRLSGGDLYKYRAIEFMNGVARRCLGEFRHQDCAFLILDNSVAYDRNRLTQEMGDAQVETFEECLKRFEAFCRI